MFRSLRPRLAAVLPPDAAIEHVGATAVSGCLTKGDLDISVQVGPEAFAAADLALSGLFERNTGSVRTDSFSAFKCDEVRPPVGIQLVVRGAPLDVFVRFRDSLLADPALIERYNALKRSQEGAEMRAYRAAKSAFIASVLGRSAGG
ncbi:MULTISPECIES: GrpB family protein [Cupriavidus]|uniref:GrpB family protein n=1 Tax=Cupriavidus sp. DF5525 TaxID=3160989 RepID=UPI0026AFB856